ncbi:MAG TPA: methyl-accepting chemotaxis protein [Gemmatimonadales bacterium]
MHWTVSRRIAAGVAAGLALVVAVGVIATIALRDATQAYETALDYEQRQLLPAVRSEVDFRRAVTEFVGFLAEPHEEILRSRDSSYAIARGYVEQLGAAAETPQAGEAWRAVLTDMTQWDEASRAAINAARAGRRAEALSIRDGRAVPARTAAARALRQQQEQVENRAAAIVRESQATVAGLRSTLLLTAVLAVAVGVVAGALLNRAVSAPLKETTGVLASSAAEILAATTQQASGASETSAAVAETVATVDQVTATAEQAAQRAREIERSSRTALDASVAAMNDVKQQVESVAESILALAEQGQAIGDIIASVTDIAEQTNLLALNAAVEAARAGEQGRGFAVVAGEVKSLAEQSKKATGEVRRILGEIQRATSAAVMTTEQGTKQVAATTRQVTEAVGGTAQAAAQIVASAGQQAAGMTQIRLAIGNIREATQQNLASTKQAERAAQDLNALGGKLLHLVGGDRHQPARGVSS